MGRSVSQAVRLLFNNSGAVELSGAVLDVLTLPVSTHDSHQARRWPVHSLADGEQRHLKLLTLGRASVIVQWPSG